MSTKKGFTLIELLVVIAVISLLSAVVLASLSTARRKARDSRRIDDQKQIQIALELHFSSHGSYPYPNGGGSATSSLIPDFMPKYPSDPGFPQIPAASPYDYWSEDGSAYCIGTTLEDSNHPATENASTGCFQTLADYGEMGISGINYALSSH